MPIFTGNYIYKIDAKGRINIPALLLKELSDDSNKLNFHITIGLDPCIYLYPRQVFKQRAAVLQQECGSFFTPKTKRNQFRRTMAFARPIRCDQQGRIIIPKEHLEKAHINEIAVVVGVGDWIELWNPELFNQYVGETGLSDEE